METLARSPIAQPQVARRRDRWALLLVGLVALAAALRFAALGTQSLDPDEGFTAEIARKSLSGALSQIPETESTPPLYYVLAWLWSRVFGTSAAGLRSLSALAGTLTVPALYVAGAALASRRVGATAAALGAVSPLLVWYSQEARAYALFVLLAATGLALFARALERPSAGRLAAWTLVSAAAVATHYFAILAVAPQAALLLTRARRRATVAGVAGVAAAAAALLPLAVHQHDHVSRPWTEFLSVRDELLATGQGFLVGLKWSWLIHRPGVLLTAVLFAASLALLVGRGSDRERRAGIVAAIVAGAGLATLLALALSGTHYLAPGNAIAAWPALAVLFALGVAGTRAGRTGLVIAGTACAALLAISVGLAADPALQRADWRGAVESVTAPGGPRAVIVLDGTQDAPVVSYYLGERGRAWRPSDRSVREVVAIGRPLEVAAAARVVPGSGLVPAGVRSFRGVAVARYAAKGPVVISRRPYGRRDTRVELVR